MQAYDIGVKNRWQWNGADLHAAYLRTAEKWGTINNRRRFWVGSPFEPLLELGNKRLGLFGQDWMEDYFKSLYYDVRKPERPGDLEPAWDLEIEGFNVEVKTSMLYCEDNGMRRYQFNHVGDADYHLLLCLGISPERVHGWMLTKARARRLAHQQGRTNDNDRILRMSPFSPPKGRKTELANEGNVLWIVGNEKVA